MFFDALTRVAKYLYFFSEEKFPTLIAITACFKYHKTLRCVKPTSRIFQFCCYDYFEDLLVPITYAKKFVFLAGVVSKIFAIKNVLATNRNALLQQARNKTVA